MHGGLVGELAIVTGVAAVTGMLFRRIGQPSILGYLLAGLIVGPYIPIPLFADPERMAELAELGVVLVMFAVGLEFRVGKLLEILPVSGLAAIVQICALGWAGYTVGAVLGWSTVASVCLGATVAISSTMVVSAVLRAHPVDPDVRSHVFGILVMQDVTAIVLIAVVTGLASGDDLGLQSLGLLVGQLAGFVAAMLIVALLGLPRLVRSALRQADAEVVVVLVVGAAFCLAFAAQSVGYSAALGAFIAGMAVAESGRAHEVEKAVEPLRSLFSAIFFVSIGMTVDPVVAWQSLPLALVLCVVVIGMQFGSVTLATLLSGSSLRRAVYSGLVLGQIGELSFILATIAIAGGIAPKELLPALVTVATVTAFTTPQLLRRAQRIVEVLDGMIPDRAQQALAAYQAFVRRAGEADDGPSLRRPAIAIGLDWAALAIILVARYTLASRLHEDHHLMLNVGGGILAAAFIVGLVRSGHRLARNARALARDQADTSPRARAVEALAGLGAVVAVGLPTMALVSPLVSGPWSEVVFVLLLLLAVVTLGLRLGSLQGTYTSGVARFATELADRVAPGESVAAPVVTPTEPLAGLDYQMIAVAADAAADGRTLAELNLRCSTGATVVAISRGDDTTTLPTGTERLQAGDVLAVSGSAEALGRATEILVTAGAALSPALPQVS